MVDGSGVDRDHPVSGETPGPSHQHNYVLQTSGHHRWIGDEVQHDFYRIWRCDDQECLQVLTEGFLKEPQDNVQTGDHFTETGQGSLF